MNEQVQAATALEWVRALAPIASTIGAAIVSGFLGYHFGRKKSEYDLKLENQKALCGERKEHIKVWREAIQMHTERVEGAPAAIEFKRESFALSLAYLILQTHLPEELKNQVEAMNMEILPSSDPFVNAEINIIDHSINSLEVRRTILARIADLEREWGLV